MYRERQANTPLFTALVEHAGRNPIQFHIPAHKKGAGLPNEFREFIGANALSIDLINIAPLDDLHHPIGIIREAQELAAEAFLADRTFFSVQGTTGAIMTMIMSVAGPGDKLLLPRNIHKSFVSSIILSGAYPVFMQPDVDENWGITHGVCYETVAAMLEQHPDTKAVLLINPTYYGVTCDLPRIIELAHSKQIPVIVDEAHGVHLPFHPGLPMSAMQAGADLAATSVHKMGGSMTQSSVLNVRSDYVNAEHVHAILSMLHTTSTSYLLLASLDVARKNLALNGHELLDRAIDLANRARAEINRMPGLVCMGTEVLNSSARVALDPLKLTISVKGLGITGHDAERMLRNDFNIEVELSDLANILCIITFGDKENDVDILLGALRSLSERFQHQQETAFKVHLPPQMPELRMSPREAFYSKTEIVPFSSAIGRTFAELVMVYPPGIPILLPGEVVTQESIDYIRENVNAGLPVQGPDDPTLELVRVVVE
ncbi:MAG: arginine decarboxylase [Bacilli bacterium]|nr:arginine decarboxylase [Bacilli bacterium]